MNLKIFIVLFITSNFVFAQDNHLYTKKEYVLLEYDLVEYFNNKVIKGNKSDFSFTYKKNNFAFSTKENLEQFKVNPEKYLPQYGGHCSYAMATLGKKVSPNPEVFEIRDGKLYFFHREKGKENWQNGDTKKLKLQADKNWKKLTDIN